MEPNLTNPGAVGTTEPPALPWEATRKPPWRPKVSGIASIFCGPFAGGLISHANLRRLGSPRKGLLILALTTLYTAFFSLVLLRLSEVSGTLLSKFGAYFILPFLFPMLQRKEFARWRADHPKVEPAEDWRATGLALLGFVGFAVIYAGVSAIPLTTEVRDMEIEVFAPSEASREDEFEIKIVAKNTAAAPQTILEIRIENTYLRGVSILGANPSFRTSTRDAVAGEQVYEFNQAVPAKSQAVIHLRARAKSLGEHKGELGVCINYATSCLYYVVDLKVSAEE